MDRFRPPTFEEEQTQIELERIYEQLFEELGREPTDEEIEAMYDYYMNEYEHRDYYPEDFQEEE